MYLAILLINCIFQWFFVLDKLKQTFFTESRLHVWLAYPPGRRINLYKNTLAYLIKLLDSQKTYRNIRGLYFSCIFEYIFFCKFICQFYYLKKVKSIGKICLWGIFHISPYYKFLKWCTYLKLDHFIAHISAYHLTFFGNLETLMVLTVDTSSRWELETLCHTLSLY